LGRLHTERKPRKPTERAQGERIENGVEVDDRSTAKSVIPGTAAVVHCAFFQQAEASYFLFSTIENYSRFWITYLRRTTGTACLLEHPHGTKLIRQNCWQTKGKASASGWQPDHPPKF
jgi:hypothetical protein